MHTSWLLQLLVGGSSTSYGISLEGREKCRVWHLRLNNLVQTGTRLVMVDLEVTEEPGWSVSRLLVLSACKARVPRGRAARGEQLLPANTGMARAGDSRAGSGWGSESWQQPAAALPSSSWLWSTL